MALTVKINVEIKNSLSYICYRHQLYQPSSMLLNLCWNQLVQLMQLFRSNNHTERYHS